MSETTSASSDAATDPDPFGGDDLSAVISAAWDEHTTPEAEPTGRDERGRFTSTAQDTATDADEKTDQPEAEAPEPAAEPAVEAPTSWSEGDKAHWTNLTPEVREIVLRTERERQEVAAERDAERAYASKFRDVITPYQSKHAMMGLDDAEAAGRLFRVQAALENDFDQALPALIRAYGRDPQQYAYALLGSQVGAQQQQPTAQLHDPRVDQILQMQEQREREQAATSIDAFGRDPAHPHFEAVRYQMGVLISANPALTMQDAYDRAVWGEPSTRSKLIEAERAKVDADRRKASAETVAKKRAAGVSVRSDPASNGNGNRANGSDSIEAAIRAAWSDLEARV